MSMRPSAMIVIGFKVKEGVWDPSRFLTGKEIKEFKNAGYQIQIDEFNFSLHSCGEHNLKGVWGVAFQEADLYDMIQGVNLDLLTLQYQAIQNSFTERNWGTPKIYLMCSYL